MSEIHQAPFNACLADWPPERIRALFHEAGRDRVEEALNGRGFTPERLAALLSPAARPYLEDMAQQATLLTRQRFGRTLQFYVPLYVSNYCKNACAYCGFNCRNSIRRHALSVEEAMAEALYLQAQGFRHLLLVSGEDPEHVPMTYFEELAQRLRPHFSSLSIEIYPLSRSDYRRLVDAGVDGLTLYQETYDRRMYNDVHPAGPKQFYTRRLEAVEDGARAGMQFIGIGTLLGLSDWHIDAFSMGLHAHYLQTTYWRQNVSVSFPRMQQAAGGIAPRNPVTDTELVQIMCALRLLLPDVGMVLSTRESPALRDHLLPLVVTRLSAGSRTWPGAYASSVEAEHQFCIQDDRTLADMVAVAKRLGFDPVLKDWDSAFHAAVIDSSGCSQFHAAQAQCIRHN